MIVVESVAQEVAAFGIGMTTVEPGGARTEFRHGSAQVAELRPEYCDPRFLIRFVSDLIGGAVVLLPTTAIATIRRAGSQWRRRGRFAFSKSAMRLRSVHVAPRRADLGARGRWGMWTSVRLMVESSGVSGVFHVDEESYDDFMGRYSVLLAPLFAGFAGVRDGQRVLDVGAGTGALTRELVARGADVVAAEPSPEFTRALRVRFPQIEVHDAPAEDLPFAKDSFEIALAQLVVAFMADAVAAMRELSRVAQRVAICMWGVEEVEMFAAIDRTARVVGSGSAARRAPRYRKPQELNDLLLGAGLTNVESSELDVTASYEDFEDFWEALSRQVGPAGAWLHGLDDRQRALAHDELHRQLGSPSGPFKLNGRAFAAGATRPS